MSGQIEMEMEQNENTNENTNAQVMGYETTSQLIDTLVKHDIPADIAKVMAVELTRDPILANYTEAETNEIKYDLKNVLEYMTSLFPPHDSLVQGDMRIFLGFNDARISLSGENYQRVRSVIKMIAYGRVTRARNGWQQNLMAQQTKEVRQISGSGGGQEKKSWFNKLFG